MLKLTGAKCQMALKYFQMANDQVKWIESVWTANEKLSGGFLLN